MVVVLLVFVVVLAGRGGGGEGRIPRIVLGVVVAVGGNEPRLVIVVFGVGLGLGHIGGRGGGAAGCRHRLPVRSLAILLLLPGGGPTTTAAATAHGILCGKARHPPARTALGAAIAAATAAAGLLPVVGGRREGDGAVDVAVVDVGMAAGGGLGRRAATVAATARCSRRRRGGHHRTRTRTRTGRAAIRIPLVRLLLEADGRLDGRGRALGRLGDGAGHGRRRVGGGVSIGRPASSAAAAAVPEEGRTVPRGMGPEVVAAPSGTGPVRGRVAAGLLAAALGAGGAVLLVGLVAVGHHRRHRHLVARVAAVIVPRRGAAGGIVVVRLVAELLRFAGGTATGTAGPGHLAEDASVEVLEAEDDHPVRVGRGDGLLLPCVGGRHGGCNRRSVVLWVYLRQSSLRPDEPKEMIALHSRQRACEYCARFHWC